MILNLLRCPFCKTSNYAVEYRGVRTKEEKGMEQIVSFVSPMDLSLLGVSVWVACYFYCCRLDSLTHHFSFICLGGAEGYRSPDTNEAARAPRWRRKKTEETRDRFIGKNAISFPNWIPRYSKWQTFRFSVICTVFTFSSLLCVFLFSLIIIWLSTQQSHHWDVQQNLLSCFLLKTLVLCRQVEVKFSPDRTGSWWFTCLFTLWSFIPLGPNLWWCFCYL